MMPIQRTPRGLSDVLSIFGGQTPKALEESARGIVDLLQFYGLSQRTTQQNVTVAAENAPLVITVPPNQWWLLYGASLQIAKTATMTALRGVIQIGSTAYASGELGPFGATETGNVHVPFVPASPMVLPPGTSLVARASIIGTDANATCQFDVDVGILG
jgi:hypothetical protein